MTPTRASRSSATAYLSHRTSRFPWTYTRIDILTAARRVDTIFFVFLLPLGMYLFFGKLNNYETLNVGHGNVTAAIMLDMAAFSVGIASSSQAASAAVDVMRGWGRQMSLTHGGMRSYILAKLTSVAVICLVPILLIFIAGYFTGAIIDSPWRWIVSYALCMLTALPMATYGMAVGLWMPSNTAVGVASSSVSIYCFLGNLFIPLSGTLLTLAHYTPMYGAGALASWLVQDGTVMSLESANIHEPLWYSVANMAAWTAFFMLICVAARRRITARR